VTEYAGQPPEDGAETRPEAGWPDGAHALEAEKPLYASPVEGQTSASLSAPGKRRALAARRVMVVLCVVIVVLGGVAGWGLYAMQTNEQRAVSWQRRAQKLQANAAQLESLLEARTRLLNQRIDQMNRIARKLKLSQVALSQSQGDVTSLEERQRELANEKAQLQDQQRTLDQVAGTYVACKQDLIQLLSDFANGYDTTSSYNTANTDCTYADDSLQGYLGTYPNG
jgi:TolA-binding protein